MDKRCILVTGTVVPNSNFVAHANVEQRLREYYESLVYYSLIFPDEPICFLENSIYDFSKNKQFQELFSKKNISLMKFPVSEKFHEGKGYQEFEMLDKAVDQLSFKYDSFIKITGRYKVLNLKSISNIEYSGLMIDCHKKTKVAQTNVFFVNAAFYTNHLRALYLKVNDSKGIYIENVIYEKIFSANLEQDIELFPFNPAITGTSGSYGGTLNRNKLKMVMRNFERKLLRVMGIKQFLIEY